MQHRYVRSLTALAVIAVCGWPIWKGFEIISYSVADPKPEAVQSWFNVPGLAFSAREYALTPIDDSDDDATIRKRQEEIEKILQIRPMSSRYWLKLAETRVDAHADFARAVDALEMSTLTGPNEGYMITQRGLFGIWQWDKLSPDLRRQTIADLVTRQVSDGKLAWLKSYLASKPESDRQEIFSALQTGGFSENNLSRIGF